MIIESQGPTAVWVRDPVGRAPPPSCFWPWLIRPP